MNPDGFENSALGDCYSLMGRYNQNGTKNFLSLIIINKWINYFKKDMI
jgi:hypothetical protein